MNVAEEALTKEIAELSAELAAAQTAEDWNMARYLSRQLRAAKYELNDLYTCRCGGYGGCCA